MRRILIFISGFILLVIIFINFITSCNNDVYLKKSCKSNYLLSRISDKQVVLEGKTIDVKLVFVRDENHSLNYEWSYARGNVDQKAIKKFLVDLGLTNFDKQVFYLKLFFPNRKIIKGKNLHIEEIVGFSVYYIDNENKVYERICKKTTEVIGNYHIKSISSAVGAYTLYNIFKVPNKQGTIVALNGSSNIENKSLVWRKNNSEFHNKAKNAYFEMKKNLLTYRQPDCPEECEDGPNIDCDVYPPAMSCANMFDNEGGICDREMAYKELRNVDSTKVYADSSIIKFGDYYNFRNIVLSNTIKGQNIIDIYYRVSEIFKEENILSFSQKVKLTKYFLTNHNKIIQLINSESNKDVILLNEIESKYLISMLNDFKNSNSIEFNNYIDQLISYVDEIKGLNIENIIVWFEK